jgi:hypothetical protein
MAWFLVLIVILGLIGVVLKWLGPALYFVFLYLILPVIGLTLIYAVVLMIYHALNPDAKKAYLERMAEETEKIRKRKERVEAEANAEKERAEAEARRKAYEHQQHRDGDQQDAPYTYKIGRHGNESLAIRYGIANQEEKVDEYWYHAKGGERKRNPDRDRVYFEPAKTIRLQKTRKLSEDLYEVLLSDFRDRRAKAIIEVGTEYVKTFYPLDDRWFEKYADLEETLKGNGSFTLKELATFHVQKTVGK